MGVSKTVSEAKKLLEPIGYEFAGVNGNKHLIWRHAETGAIYRMSQSGWKDGGAQKGGVASAQRRVRHAQSVGHRFVAWLLDECNVGVTEEKRVAFSISKMGAKFLAEHRDVHGTSEGLWRIALTGSSQATLVTPGKRGVPGAVSVWDLRGPLFGVEPLTVESEEADGHDEAAGRDTARNERGADPAAVVVSADAPVDDGADGQDTEPEPEVDGREPAAPVEPVDAGRGGSATLTLPPTLVEALAEHFQGDLVAERELALETLTEAGEALLRAHAAIQEAVALIGSGGATGRQRSQHPHPKAGMGARNLHRWKLIEAHRDELGEQFGAEDIERLLLRLGEPLTHSAAGSLMWVLAENGLLHRRSRGVYAWAA